MQEFRYLRTQITRTTAAFASIDPPAALTPLALRNSRTASAGTSTAWAAGAAFDTPATSADFNNAMPLNLPPSSPPAAGRPRRLDRGCGAAAGLILRVGNADQFDTRLVGLS